MGRSRRPVRCHKPAGQARPCASGTSGTQNRTDAHRPPAAASAPPPSAEMPEPKATLKPPPTHPFLIPPCPKTNPATGASSLLKTWFEGLRAARRSPAKPERSRRDGVCRASPRRVQALFQVRPIDRDRTDMQVDLGARSSPGRRVARGAGQGAAPGRCDVTLTSAVSA